MTGRALLCRRPQQERTSTMIEHKGFGNKRRTGHLRIKPLMFATVLLTIFGLALLQAQRGSSYSFTKLATLGEKAILAPPPAGPSFHINDFEPGGLNNHGDVIYGTDLGTSADPKEWAATGFGEGV